jgi:hypothetical protein
MKIIIPTYRDIQWILPCYMHLHHKYWNHPVTIIAEENYLPDCEFVIPPQADNGTVQSGDFSDVLIWYLLQLKDKFICIMLSDYMITKPVGVDMIYALIGYMDEHDNILRCQLGNMFGSENSSRQTDTIGDIEIREGNFLPTSLTPGIWNRELLLEMLNSNTCAWGLEIKGRDKFVSSSWRSICPVPQPIDYINALRGRITDKMVSTPEIIAEIGHMIPNNVAY